MPQKEVSPISAVWRSGRSNPAMGDGLSKQASHTKSVKRQHKQQIDLAEQVVNKNQGGNDHLGSPPLSHLHDRDAKIQMLVVSTSHDFLVVERIEIESEDLFSGCVAILDRRPPHIL